MPMLIGFAGFGGAGKTTAIEYLEGQGFGRRVYLGQAVLDEIDLRGLKRSPSVEQDVRTELRGKYGPSVFGNRAAAHIAEILSIGERVLVDAIFNIEEYRRLQSCGQTRSVLVAIDASFETRSRRILERHERRYTGDELRERDRTETEKLGTSSVLQLAEFTVSNESSLADFQRNLDKLSTQIGD